MTDANNPSQPKVGCNVLIVGASLAGLYAGYLLGRANVRFAILETDDRSGDRVYSRPEASSALGLTLDEGANRGVAEFLVRRRWATGHRRRLLERARLLVEDEGFDWAGVEP